MTADETERLRLLGDLVRARRQWLDLGWKDVGISPATYSKVEGGKAKASSRTYTKLERLLKWKQGSCLRFLAEGIPPEETDSTRAEIADPDDQLARIVSEWRKLSSQDRWFLMAMLDSVAKKNAANDSAGSTDSVTG